MRIVFMGTGEIAIPTLRWLVEEGDGHELVGVFTQPDRKVGRKQVVTPPEVKQIALAAGIPVIQPESLRKEPESIESLREWEPDVIVVMAYGQILPDPVLEAPRIACVNLHASLLPRHRGASPIQAAIREGDEETGLTLMHIAPALDAGDMLLAKSIRIRSEDTGGTLHDRLAELGPALIEEGLRGLAEGTLDSVPQDESAVTYAGKLDRGDGRIVWNLDAEALERQVRAYDPWPGSHTEVEDEGRVRQLKIFSPTRIHPDRSGDPGTVLESGDRLLIACGTGALELCGSLQFEGRKRLSVEDFLRGVPLPEGTRLGSADGSA